jgi:hypothetical protein
MDHSYNDKNTGGDKMTKEKREVSTESVYPPVTVAFRGELVRFNVLDYRRFPGPGGDVHVILGESCTDNEEVPRGERRMIQLRTEGQDDLYSTPTPQGNRIPDDWFSYQFLETYPTTYGE